MAASDCACTSSKSDSGQRAGQALVGMRQVTPKRAAFRSTVLLASRSSVGGSLRRHRPGAPARRAAAQMAVGEGDVTGFQRQTLLRTAGGFVPAVLPEQGRAQVDQRRGEARLQTQREAQVHLGLDWAALVVQRKPRLLKASSAGARSTARWGLDGLRELALVDGRASLFERQGATGYCQVAARASYATHRPCARCGNARRSPPTAPAAATTGGTAHLASAAWRRVDRGARPAHPHHRHGEEGRERRASSRQARGSGHHHLALHQAVAK